MCACDCGRVRAGVGTWKGGIEEREEIDHKKQSKEIRK